MRLQNGRWLLVVAIAWVLMMGGITAQVVLGAEDSKETITLKRDLLVEKILRLQTAAELMKRDFAAIQVEIPKLQEELKKIQARLDAMNKPVDKEPAKEKK